MELKSKRKAFNYYTTSLSLALIAGSINFTAACGHLTKSTPVPTPVAVPAVLDPVKIPSKIDKNAFVRYEYKTGELLELCQSGIKNFEQQMQAWRDKYEKEKLTSTEPLLRFEALAAQFEDDFGALGFIGKVSPQAAIRDESTKCKEALSKANNNVYTDRKNYLILSRVMASNPDELRLLKETKLDFEMNGMKLSDTELAQFKNLKDRLSFLALQFGQNLNDDVSTVSFTADELIGCKADFLARLKKDNLGNYIVTTKQPDYLHVMENASITSTRKKMSETYNNRQSATNTPLLQEAIKVRADLSKLLGFSNFADYTLQRKMARDAKTVFAFLNGLRKKLVEKNKSDLKALADFKAHELKDKSPLESWDIAYVSNQIKIQKYAVDEDQVREYFPAQKVVEQTMEIYAQLLGVRFHQIANAPVWANNVELYEVLDNESGQSLAYFYTDLIPREGKYGHAAAMPIIIGHELDATTKTYQKPVSAMVANFTPATPGKPSLLSIKEVETFFHEFGHIMHQTLTRAKYTSLSGSSVKRDFVEAPSQMLENWVWEKTILAKMSQHYGDPNKKLPEPLMDRLLKLRKFNSGILNTGQLVFGLYDMNIHTNPNLDVTNEFSRLFTELTTLKMPEGTHFPAGFGHVMSGYSAGYYGYLWSKVYAEDMFSVFEKSGILNSKVGLKYRKFILEPGNMRDPGELVKAFLGRDPNKKAFMKSLGL